MSTVALLTDFGTRDSFVGVMKGVLLKSSPELSVVDVTHEIPPQDVRLGAFHLRAAYADFPRGTLFLAVVDPGVGSDRKIIYAEAGGQKFLAPDNGLLSWVFEKTPPSLVFEIPLSASPVKEISSTFHGRDVFAPVAGRILNGESPSSFGKLISTWATLLFPKVNKVGSMWKGEVLCVDGFGNLITNFETKDVEQFSKAAKLWIELGEPPITIRGLASSYSSVEKGKLLAIGGSVGFLEISVRDGSAAKQSHLSSGSRITLYFRT